MIGGSYVNVLDDRKLVAASPGKAATNRRWRVRDNLPGTAAFCPIVRKTREWSRAVAVDVRQLLQELEAEFGEELLLRSAVWMTLRESKASFAIEGETDQTDRIQRFADVLARRTGEGDSWRAYHSPAVRSAPITGVCERGGALSGGGSLCGSTG